MKEENVIWVIKIPKTLKERVRSHVSKNDDWSMSAFTQKAVEYLLRSEKPLQIEMGNSSPLVVSVPPDFDRRMRTLAVTNYPSISCLIRTAILTQLILEEQEKNQGQWTPPTSSEQFLINMLHGKIIVI